MQSGSWDSSMTCIAVEIDSPRGGCFQSDDCGPVTNGIRNATIPVGERPLKTVS